MRRGITPDGGGAYLLPRMIGLAKAKELVFLGDDLSAADAERIGLINKVVPAGRPRQGRRRVGRAAGEGSDEGDLARRSGCSTDRSTSDRAGAFDDEAWAQELASRTEDFAEGVQAFVDRRDVEFRGW